MLLQLLDHISISLTGIIINGISCSGDQVITVAEICSSDHQPEGAECGIDANPEGYCSYSVGPYACAKCGYDGGPGGSSASSPSDSGTASWTACSLVAALVAAML